MKSHSLISRIPALCLLLYAVSAAKPSSPETATFHFVRGPNRSAFALMTPHLRHMFVRRYQTPQSATRAAAATVEADENRQVEYETAGSQRTSQQVATSLGLGQYANSIPQYPFADDIRKPALSAIQKALMLQQFQKQTAAYQRHQPVIAPQAYQQPAQAYQQPAQAYQQPAQVYQQQAQAYQQQAQAYQQPIQAYQQPTQAYQQQLLAYQQAYQQPQTTAQYYQAQQPQQAYYQPEAAATGYDQYQQLSQQQLQQLYQQQLQQQSQQQRTGPVQFQQQQPSVSAADVNSIAESASEQQNTQALLGVAYSPSTDVSSFKYASHGLNYNF